MQIFTYRARDGERNQAQINKGPLDKVSYIVDFADGILGSATLSSTSVGAQDSSAQVVTSACVGTTTISGTTVQQTLLTCGTSGTQAAINDSRFRIDTDVTLSNGEILRFSTFVYVNANTYSPDS